MAQELCKSQYASQTRQEEGHQAEPMQRGPKEWNEGGWDQQFPGAPEGLGGRLCFSWGGQIARRRCGLSYAVLGELKVWGRAGKDPPTSLKLTRCTLACLHKWLPPKIFLGEKKFLFCIFFFFLISEMDWFILSWLEDGLEWAERTSENL